MPIITDILSRFTMGELSPLLSGRVDLAKYPAAMKELENFIPLLQGPVRRRGGTRFIAKSGNGDKPVVLFDFAFSTTTTYILEIGHRYMRFYNLGRPVLDEEGDIYQIETPWTQEDLFNSDGICLLKRVQSGDVMYIVCPGQPPHKLSRHGHTEWGLELLIGWNADKERPNATAIALWRERLVLAAEQTLYLSQSGAFENFELTKATAASKGVITAVHIWNDNYIQLAGDGLIASGGSSRTQVRFSSTQAQATQNDQWNMTITPRTIAGGKEVEIAADDPIEINVYSEQMDKIEWLVPAGNLLVGTTGGEFIVGETTTIDPLGPENIKIVPETAFGSTPIQALRVGSVVIFVQRAGRKVREFIYDFTGDSYTALDLTVAAEHVTSGGVTAMAWQSEPIETLWSVRGDGQLLGFTYSKDQDMNAWHRHIIGGGGLVSHLAVVPALHGGRDELWLSVRREVAGETVHYLEVMDEGLDSGQRQAEAFFLDCGKTFRGRGLTGLTGLDYLEGCRVDILADGGVQTSRTVKDGRLSLQHPADVVQVGLPYESRLTTVRLESQMMDGTVQGRKKRIIGVTLRLLESGGGKAGKAGGLFENMVCRKGREPLNSPPALFTGDYKLSWPHGYETDADLTVIADSPLPFVLTAIIPDVAVEGKN